ncbi:helix-turn-helix transcriptional regulator [Saccharomonospora azurea]|uniref:helix-turn-helix transcriptional regulator n=1 Tax=Saccharomonospora azurea TaxID=40988 RepID=UPI0033287C82
MTESFGTLLRHLRRQLGLSQPELARMVPISQSSLSRYEADRQAPTLTVAERLDDLLSAGGGLRNAARAVTVVQAITPDDVDRIDHHIRYPSCVDACTVRALSDLLAAQRRLDDTLGPQPVLPMATSHMRTVLGMVRAARGPHRTGLVEVASQCFQFTGWLHAELGNQHDAVHHLAEAESLADEAGNGVLAAQVAGFRGAMARQNGNARATVRWFMSEYHASDAHIAQRVGAAAQAAQGYAVLGERDAALRLLDTAGNLIDVAARDEPPATAYWLTPTYHRLNFGLAHLALNDHEAAADHLAAGLASLPAEQLGSEWVQEYKDAHERALERR